MQRTEDRSQHSAASASRFPPSRQLRSISNPPAEIGIEFGVQLSAQTGAFIASAAAAANFKVSMTWRGGAAET